MESILERELPQNQAGFRRGRGTRDQIANIRWLMERQKEFGQDVHMCFIDYSKAFDCIDHEALWCALQRMGVPEHLIALMKSLYENQQAVVKTESGDTDSFTVEKGVRQGCILSPSLFNLYAENIMREAELDETVEGIHIGGRILNNLRYADDTTLLANRKQGLQNLLKRVKKASEKSGLYLNMKKTKILTTAKWNVFELDGEEIEVVKDFSLLGSLIDRDGGCKREVKRRMALSKQAMVGLQKIWKDKNITLRTKMRLVKAMVFPVALYGCEAWTKTKAIKKKLDVTEMWMWRRMLRISWTEKRTNESVLEEIGEELTLQCRASEQKLSYFGHVVRACGLEKDVMLGCGAGRRKRGRPRMRWLDEIEELTAMNIAQLKEAALNRMGWRRLIKTVARGQRSTSTR
jgi:hypothetical protein